MADEVNKPPHYTKHPSGTECIEITEHMNFCLGNAVKYIWRSGLKTDDPIKDLKKAAWYINREIERLSKQDRKSALDELSREGQDLKMWEWPVGINTVREDHPFERAYSHTIVPSGNESESECCEASEQSKPKTSEWIPHDPKAGGCPVGDDVIIDVKHRDDSTSCNQRAQDFRALWVEDPNLPDYKHDIIAYRVVK